MKLCFYFSITDVDMIKLGRKEVGKLTLKYLRQNDIDAAINSLRGKIYEEVYRYDTGNNLKTSFNLQVQ